MPAAQRPSLLVLAGVNGSGKSSVAGARLRALGSDYFNPDEVTRQLREAGVAAADANSLAWREGRDRLQHAIMQGESFAIETTLGGHTLPALVDRACASHDVTLWYIGLDTPEHHLARVAARTAAGGHSIPDRKIRVRWGTSRANLIALLPHVREVFVYDNSKEASLAERATPILLLHMRNGRVIEPSIKQLADTPEWAKAIVESALRIDDSMRSRRKRP